MRLDDIYCLNGKKLNITTLNFITYSDFFLSLSLSKLSVPIGFRAPADFADIRGT